MNILLVDDHLLFREGLASMLRSQPDMTVVGEAANVSEAILRARETRPDLILLDYTLPDGNGPEAARAILSELPNTEVVFLTIHEDDSYLLAAIRSGATGYLKKDLTFGKLVQAIRGVAQKEPAIAPQQMRSLMREIAHPSVSANPYPAVMADFTARELEILRYLALDASNQEIANHLAMSVAAIKNYVHRLFRKLNLKNRRELGIFARQQGLLKEIHF